MCILNILVILILKIIYVIDSKISFISHVSEIKGYILDFTVKSQSYIYPLAQWFTGKNHMAQYKIILMAKIYYSKEYTSGSVGQICT